MALLYDFWCGCHVNAKHAVSHQMMSSVMSYWTWIPGKDTTSRMLHPGVEMPPPVEHLLWQRCCQIRSLNGTTALMSVVLLRPFEGMSERLYTFIRKLLGTLFYTVTLTPCMLTSIELYQLQLNSTSIGWGLLEICIRNCIPNGYFHHMAFFL